MKNLLEAGLLSHLQVGAQMEGCLKGVDQHHLWHLSLQARQLLLVLQTRQGSSVCPLSNDFLD